jgi:hypothetical protein
LKNTASAPLLFIPLPHSPRGTSGTSFCAEASQEAIAKYGNPEIENTEQGSSMGGRD